MDEATKRVKVLEAEVEALQQNRQNPTASEQKLSVSPTKKSSWW